MNATYTAHLAIDTPLGRMRLARTPQGLAGAWFVGQKHEPAAFDGPEAPDDPLLRKAAAQILAYMRGERPDFDLPLDPAGTDFQRRVWGTLRRIDAGRTRSYADIARAIGSPDAVRAVGSAVGRNPVSIIVPCHRVLGSDGSLTGYAGGLDRKRALLRLEGLPV